MLTARTPACLSRLACDQLLNREHPDAAAAEAHVAACVRCTARLADHRRERAAFVIPRARGHWYVVALAAAVFAVVAWPRGEVTRTKGGPVLGFYRKHGEVITRGANGERVAPGDVLDFTVASPVPAFVAVISVDGARQITAYYPAGPLAVAVSAGEQLLPLAVRLDDVRGREQLHGLFCTWPAPVAALIDAIARGAAPAGCTDDTLAIEKP